MKIKVNRLLNTRVAAPDNLLLPGRYFKKGDLRMPGDEIEVVRSVKGENVHSADGDNDIWYFDGNDKYYWSGGVELREATLSSPPVWMQKLNIETIWNTYNEYGANAKVAVLDTGFKENNPDLTAAVNKNYQVFCSPDMGINDVDGHGTHCASLIGGRNRNFITGCAPKCELYVAKISEKGSVRNFQTIINAFNWAIQSGVDIISFSNGGETNDDDLAAIIQKAVNEHNIIVIASIGDVAEFSSNSGYYPALMKECIAVGAVDNTNRISFQSVISDKTEIYAPGESISAYALNDFPESKNGTSQATAIVAGICALIISRLKSRGGHYSQTDIINLLKNNGDDIVGTQNKKGINPGKIFSNL
jgi:subtilisin family serine protease